MECSCYLLANYSSNCFILASFYVFLSRYLASIFSEASYFPLEAQSDYYCLIFYADYLYIFYLSYMEDFLILSNYSDCSLRLLFNCSITASFYLIAYRASSFSAMNWPDSIILDDRDSCSISFSFFTYPNYSLRLDPSFFHIYDSAFNFFRAPIASLRSASLCSSSADFFFYAYSILLRSYACCPSRNSTFFSRVSSCYLIADLCIPSLFFPFLSSSTFCSNNQAFFRLSSAIFSRIFSSSSEMTLSSSTALKISLQKNASSSNEFNCSSFFCIREEISPTASLKAYGNSSLSSISLPQSSIPILRSSVNLLKATSSKVASSPLLPTALPRLAALTTPSILRMIILIRAGMLWFQMQLETYSVRLSRMAETQSSNSFSRGSIKYKVIYHRESLKASSIWERKKGERYL